MHIRGISDPDNVESFLAPSLGQLRDPSNMKGMKDACERIADAIEKTEKIGIFTDYDVDGVCSAALIHRFLVKIGYMPPSVFIPDRTTDGYGLNKRGIDELHNQGVTLLITSDCGITACAEVDYAKEIGMDVIITDHHEIGDQLPEALSIINPKLTDCPFHGEDLCGAGVVFHMIVSLRACLRHRGMEGLPNLKGDLDLVAMATVADVVSLSGINRILVKQGLNVLNSASSTGISALAEVSGLKRKVITRDIGFILSPRINAAGRIDDARKAFNLLTTEDYKDAVRIARELDALNRQRRSREQEVLQEALSMVDHGADFGNVIVAAGTGWHAGVVGIVASRLASLFNKPSIVISITDGVGMGSGRSVEGLDLHAALIGVSCMLKGFGGHKMAVGLTIDESQILPFANAIDGVIQKKRQKQAGHFEIDFKITPYDISPDFLRELELLEPFGEGNPEPVFMIPSMEVVGTKRFSTGGVKFLLRHSDRVFHSLGCNVDFDIKDMSRYVDVAFTPVKRRFNGHSYLYLSLKAMCPVRQNHEPFLSEQ